MAVGRGPRLRAGLPARPAPGPHQPGRRLRQVVPGAISRAEPFRRRDVCPAPPAPVPLKVMIGSDPLRTNRNAVFWTLQIGGWLAFLASQYLGTWLYGKTEEMPNYSWVLAL